MFSRSVVQRRAPLLNDYPSQYLLWRNFGPDWRWTQEAPESDAICWPTWDMKSILDSKLWHMPGYEKDFDDSGSDEQTKPALRLLLRLCPKIDPMFLRNDVRHALRKITLMVFCWMKSFTFVWKQGSLADSWREMREWVKGDTKP